MKPKNRIYIRSAAHISAQFPLSEDWLMQPINYSEQVVPSLDVNYREYLSVNEVRRYGKLLKRALVCARVALDRANVVCPDSIVTATGLGCIENTELFLSRMLDGDEGLMNPTPFMLSTHNMIGSVIALDLQCHGYNTHYSQKSMSFDCGLMDAFVRIRYSDNQTVLLNAHDEFSPEFTEILQRLENRHLSNGYFTSEVALSMILGCNQSDSSWCAVDDMWMFHTLSSSKVLCGLTDFLERNGVCLDDIDVVVLGINGNEANDSIYNSFLSMFPRKVSCLRYKHVFGEQFTSSGLGLYMAAVCIKRQVVPPHLIFSGLCPQKIDRVLFYNHSEGKDHSFVLMSRIDLFEHV